MNLKQTTTVIIADDHQLLREGFRANIQKFSSLKLVDEVSNGEELLASVEKFKPDVVITDIRMPVMDGIEATKKIKLNFPSVKVIILSNYEEHALIVEAMYCGADGYLIKSCSSSELFDSINKVKTGKMFFCPLSSEKILSHVETHAKTEKEPELTGRDKDLLRLISQNLTTTQIAKQLGISKRTVETLRAKVQNKLGIKGSVGLALYALKNKLT
jgi:DNA-binding NarL/FixJ family response regulator